MCDVIETESIACWCSGALDAQITRVKEEIQAVCTKIETAKREARNAANDAAGKTYWRSIEQELRTKTQRLRTKEQQLRTEKQQLSSGWAAIQMCVPSSKAWIPVVLHIADIQTCTQLCWVM